MKQRRVVHGCSFVFAACAAHMGNAAAQTALDETTLLEPIVITATSGMRFLSDAPASVTILTGQDLRERPAQDLVGAIEGTPGVQITGIGLGRKGISIRGMLPEQTLVLTNGMRVNNSASAIAHSDHELGWVPIEGIERIEVVRGPMSSLYGSEALGGVVNIITRRASDEWRGSISTTGLLSEHGLGGNRVNAAFYAGGPIIPGIVGLNVWGRYGGISELVSPDNADVSSLGQETAFTGSATLTWTPDDRQRIDLSYSAGFEKRWSDRDAGGGPFPFHYRSQDDIWRQHASVTHEGSWNWGTSRVRIYGAMLERNNQRSDGAPPSGPHKIIDVVADGQINFSPFKGHELTIGGEIRQERLKDPTVNEAGRAGQTHHALFVQDEISLGDQWQLVLGSRFDHHEAFGLHASPRAYLLYHLSDALTLKGGVGAGFKAPSLKQLSPEYEAIAGGGRFTIFGNPDLEPETNLSFEAGFEYRQGIWSVHGTAFQNEVENLIQAICVVDCSGAPGAAWSYENVDVARVRGIELGGGIELPWNLRLEANYTFLDAIDASTGERLPDRSRHMANTTLVWTPLEKLTTTFKAHYAGPQDYRESVRGANVKQKRPDYAILSAYADYRFSENASLQFGIENITDVRLADESSHYTFADEGRRYVLGLRARF